MTRYNGDTTLASIETNELIDVINGSLTVGGDINSGAKVTLIASQSNATVVTSNVSSGSRKRKLIVQGNLHFQARIDWEGDVKVLGYLDDSVEVRTRSGSIVVEGNIGANAVVMSMNGDVFAQSIHPLATIKTVNGEQYINGISRTLKLYINSFRGKESFKAIFERLGIEVAIEYYCNISFDIPNIPVLFDDKLYDFECLGPFRWGRYNKYERPITEENFILSSIKPANSIRELLENQIEEAEALEKTTSTLRFKSFCSLL